MPVLLACMPAALAAQDEAAAVAIKPRPAEIMPNAARSLMLDVQRAGDHLVAVGSRGQILLSNDGRQWKQVETPVRATLTAVMFADSQQGWAVGHDATILRTLDGGGSWALQNFQPELNKPFLSVLFLDANRGFAVGAFGLFDKTTDGGAHWSAVDAPAILGDGLHLYAIRKLGNGNLFIAGEQGLLGLSTDGGATWTKLTSPYEGTFFGAVPVGANGVVVCGLRGNAWSATDAAAPKWQKLDTGTNDSLFGCAAAGGGRVAMAGLNGTMLLADMQSGKVAHLDSGVDSTLSGVTSWKSGLVYVGESGIRELSSIK
jgi:photosystem II stability/assembly factor-like uncharacterized protein